MTDSKVKPGKKLEWFGKNPPFWLKQFWELNRFVLFNLFDESSNFD